jgi:hypothetical protein
MTVAVETRPGLPILRHFDHWLFDGCDPRMCSVLRIACATLLIVYLSMWWQEAELWFTDQGMVRAATMIEISNGGNPSLLYWLPNDPWVVKLCLALCLGQTLLLGLGVWSRFQAACIFVWLLSFQHRNLLICDGQDVLLRLLVFYLIFMPTDYAWSLGTWWRSRSDKARSDQVLSAVASRCAKPSAWGLRLVQLQITAIYFSTAWEKFQGVTWRDGTALFYVARMDDLYGRFPLPDYLFETPWILAAMTWGVLLLEAVLPLLLWIKATRPWGLLAAAGLHLSIEATMHIYLFEWLMLICLLSFVDPKWFVKAPSSRITKLSLT